MMTIGKQNSEYLEEQLWDIGVTLLSLSSTLTLVGRLTVKPNWEAALRWSVDHRPN